MNSLKTYPWDSIPHYSPTWKEIKGKAHHYKTAHLRSDGTIVSLLGILSNVNGRQLAEPVFLVRSAQFTGPMETDQLCGFVL